jgi:quercetin dioxygenase-like cupin family protein
MRRARRLSPLLGLVAGALALFVAVSTSRAEMAAPAPAPLAGEAHSGERVVVSTATTVTGEPIRCPSGAPARVTAVEITLAPGEQTGWHMHPVPLFGYILEGELTVDYGAKGERTYRTGEGFMEAMNERHNGRNSGQGPVKILAVVIGEEGVGASLPASPSGR